MIAASSSGAGGLVEAGTGAIGAPPCRGRNLLSPLPV
jgi:hypothetical protein